MLRICGQVKKCCLWKNQLEIDVCLVQSRGKLNSKLTTLAVFFLSLKIMESLPSHARTNTNQNDNNSGGIHVTKMSILLEPHFLL